MKVVFLDIDGVLNNPASFLANPEKEHPLYDMSERCFDGECVKQLQRILAETGAVMVMSSSWRMFFPIAQVALIRAGLPGCIDWTRQAKFTSKRGHNVKWWIEDWMEPGRMDGEHLPIESYVILDDSSDFLDEQKPFFVNTDGQVGLTREDADRAIEILNR